MRQLIKRLLRKIYLEDFAKDLILSLWRTRNTISWHLERKSGTDKKLVENYWRLEGGRKLHIGCGANVQDGWLNSDYYPQSDCILHLDATSRFPFGDNVFDYV